LAEIEAQTGRWIADLNGYPAESNGVLVSGGNMANFVGFLAGRAAKADWNVREDGLRTDKARQMVIYTSAETHTWVQKAADLFGMGTSAIRWIETDDQLRMNTVALRKQIERDRADGHLPFLLAGTAGSVSTGAIDPLPELAAISREHDLWFHVDGAYGGFAAAVPDVTDDIRGLSEADSVAIDPHKWLYSPLEAGCTLVRDSEALRAAFSYHPPYYHFGEEALNFVDFSMQNSRGFRALKVWLGLQQAGREGYVQMIGDDIRLARVLYDLVDEHPDFETATHSLSITTFRYIPENLRDRVGEETVEDYLNKLNKEMLFRLEKSGEAFLSNAIIGDRFHLRLCIVNFRTTLADIEALPGIVSRVGKETDAELRGAEFEAH
jgi:glutamate/tyrosine decarboxylase-like PLP-dependent enzyme